LCFDRIPLCYETLQIRGNRSGPYALVVEETYDSMGDTLQINHELDRDLSCSEESLSMQYSDSAAARKIWEIH
jgi:hypothetical protein